MNGYEPQSSQAENACLIVDHLDIGYEKVTVVTDVSFELSCGESLALVGINGSGKSTLLKTIVGLIEPIHGKVNVLGSQPHKAFRKLAYLSQSHSSGFILPLRVIDVVRMGRFSDRGLLGRMTPEDDEIVHDSMVHMGVDDLAGAPLRSLSDGQQQRVYIAQALARQADLLILDEPTSNIDAAGREVFAKVLEEELSRGAMALLATHDIQQAMDCDQTMLLAKQVVAMGPGKEILTPEALLKTFGIVLFLEDRKQTIGVLEREHGHETSLPKPSIYP
jgi:ABC-type Mn2+/Zn2+ transport system ATPase subunit